MRVILLLLSIVSIPACASTDGATIDIKIYKEFPLGNLLNKPKIIVSIEGVKLSLNKDWYSGISVKDNNNLSDVTVVNSCRNYFGLSGNYEPVKEFERSAYFEFAVVCLAAKDVAMAKPAAISYLNDFELNNNAPKVLPKEFSFYTSKTERAKALSSDGLVYWGDVNKIIKVVNITSESADFNNTSGKQELSFVAKADFNNDKIEDLLILSRSSVIGGSFTSTRLFLITKLSANSGFKLLNEYGFE